MLRITKTLKDSIVTIKVDGRLVTGETEVLVEDYERGRERPAQAQGAGC